tara:strand:- start:1331 stop:1912 length:582 start_codon:yes stop_codon:yes gene_type:complete
MIIGLDVDDVLASFVSALLVYHNDEYGTNLSVSDIKSYNLGEAWGGTKEESIKKVYDFYRSPYFRDIQPVEGSKEGIELLSRKHELVTITSRPNEIYNETIEWLNLHFPEKILEHYFTNEWHKSGNNNRSKSDVCLELGIDVIIEDCLAYAKDCASNGIKVILLDRPWNKSNGLPDKVTRVESWDRILENIYA